MKDEVALHVYKYIVNSGLSHALYQEAHYAGDSEMDETSYRGREGKTLSPLPKCSLNMAYSAG